MTLSARLRIVAPAVPCDKSEVDILYAYWLLGLRAGRMDDRCTTASMRPASPNLCVLRQARNPAPLERERMTLVLGDDARSQVGFPDAS